ncbi:2'-5' RNA ligase family protein [Halocalculus aciditolerans]|uniref:Phosphoesterase n=1 Tax=Halocalculus aciditolerans TaxID=1383812 RepID=A0A830FH47_9EURY|nr:2'-5' RNA ligase family protein [Halocalculus aciditolerans]GGL46702.1 hypothetical protein GCM10009039_01330 [Halocalculus aciditolerans]
MYSLNAPLPGEVRSLVRDLRPALVGFDRIRQHHSLLLKRLDADTRRDYLRAAERAKAALRDTAAPFEVRISRCGVFSDPHRGPGPLVYLAVESPELLRLHRHLAAELGTVEHLEGDDYTPHVTLARDGPQDAVDRVLAADFEPVTWAVSELQLYDARHHERIEAIPLPA